jgi:hypothetical protein
MMPRLVRHPWPLAALGIALAAGYHAARAYGAAHAITPTPAAADAPTRLLRPLATRNDSLSIWDAIDLDPFREDRAGAATRYRLPGDTTVTEHEVDAEVPVLTLLGTIMLSDGSGLALCQSGDEPSRLVRPGQSIAGMTLQRVDQAKATFAAADGRLTTLTVSKGGTP